MGVNFTGLYRIRLKGQPGDTITFRFGERLYEDGTLNPMTSVAGQIKRTKIKSSVARRQHGILRYSIQTMDLAALLWHGRPTNIFSAIKQKSATLLFSHFMYTGTWKFQD